MKWVFWIAAGTIAYAYLGCPLILFLRSRLRPRPVQLSPLFPSVSVVLAVHNESKMLLKKLQNLADLDYPTELIEIIVVSDGSTDETNQVLRSSDGKNVRAIFLDEHVGKAAALNQALKVAKGEIIFFTDVRQMIEPQALRYLTENFSDPAVGCASGELMLPVPEGATTNNKLGLYWTYEKKIRQWESDCNSVAGATGAIYAVRRDLIVPLPTDTLLDDVFIPMNVIRQRGRVIFDPRARAWETAYFGVEREFRRKVRTLAGNYQLLQFEPWILFGSHPVWFEFFSHKLVRLIVPFALLTMLIVSILLPSLFYRTILVLQLMFYSLAILGFLYPKAGIFSKAASSACTFTMLNAAAATALLLFVAGRKQLWVR
jgi:poly-beta-1,6-N-acetyl-D-glucosamine synthase